MILAHRCQCSHPSFFHTPAGVCTMKDGCTVPELAVEPELLPTWATDTAVGGDTSTVRVDVLLEPGTPFAGPRLCGCARCTRYYAHQK